MRIKTWLLYKIKCACQWHCKSLVFRIIDIINDHHCDKKLGIETNDLVNFKNIPESFQEGFYKDGTIFESTSYQKLRRLVDYLKLDPTDVFMDFGSGKGRVIFFVAQNKLKKVIGVEINRDLFETTLQNRSRTKPATPVEIIHGDAIQIDVREGTVFFFYNPFGLMTFTKVLSNIKESLKNDPRKVRIVYHTSLYAGLLDNQDWLEREQVMKDDRIIIWRNKH